MWARTIESYITWNESPLGVIMMDMYCTGQVVYQPHAKAAFSYPLDDQRWTHGQLHDVGTPAWQKDGPAVTLVKCRLNRLSFYPFSNQRQTLKPPWTRHLTSQPNQRTERDFPLGVELSPSNQTVCVYPSLTHFPRLSGSLFNSLPLLPLAALKAPLWVEASSRACLPSGLPTNCSGADSSTVSISIWRDSPNSSDFSLPQGLEPHSLIAM